MKKLRNRRIGQLPQAHRACEGLSLCPLSRHATERSVLMMRFVFIPLAVLSPVLVILFPLTFKILPKAEAGGGAQREKVCLAGTKPWV